MPRGRRFGEGTEPESSAPVVETPEPGPETPAASEPEPPAWLAAAEELEHTTSRLLISLLGTDVAVRREASTRYEQGGRPDTGGLVACYVLGQLGGRLGITERPRRDVPSIVEALRAAFGA